MIYSLVIRTWLLLSDSGESKPPHNIKIRGRKSCWNLSPFNYLLLLRDPESSSLSIIINIRVPMIIHCLFSLQIETRRHDRPTWRRWFATPGGAHTVLKLNIWEMSPNLTAGIIISLNRLSLFCTSGEDPMTTSFISFALLCFAYR